MRATSVSTMSTVSAIKKTMMQQAAFVLEPVVKEARKFVQEKPVVATGGGLTFFGFLASFFIKDGIKFFPIVGIPVIGAFIHEIFAKGNLSIINKPDLKEMKPAFLLRERIDLTSKK